MVAQTADAPTMSMPAAPATRRRMRDAGRVAVVGASGRSGAAFCRALHGAGQPFVPLVRDAGRWDLVGVGVTPRVTDLSDRRALAAALADAATVVNCAHASWNAVLIDAAPRDATFILMGSTRRFSRWPDAHGDGVRAGEAVFLGSGRKGVMLHPTLIYGRDEDGDVQRLARLLSRLPLVPLPGGGRALVQPIHQDDVTQCLLAAIERPWDGPQAVVIAGPRALAYRDFVCAVAAASRLRRPRLLSVPAPFIRVLARAAALIPGLPTVGPDQIRRLTEDKAFDTAPMRDLLGIVPVALEDGLALTFGGGRDAA